MFPCNEKICREYDADVRKVCLLVYGSKPKLVVNNSKNFFDNGYLMNPEFLEFPDWKKILYKKKYNQFLDHPLQTLEQGEKRQRVLIYLLNYFYGKNISEEIEYDGSYLRAGILPPQLGQVFTPKLMEVYPIERIMKYMNCICCCYLKLDKPELMELRRHKKSKIIIFKKVCDILKNGNVPSHIFLNGEQDRCPHFDFMPFYVDLIKYQIRKYFSDRVDQYNPDDYLNDINEVDLTLYFRNEYDNLINIGI